MSEIKKQFETESRKMLDMMVNSIYTHKEIFLRELISNASDAIDKRYYQALTNNDAGLDRSEYSISVKADKDSRIFTITDNGCGMSAEELEKNLGTIAKSGSDEFKNANEKTDDISVIGQFGVGFYSAFMVADKITVKSRAIGADTANIWESEGPEGYTINTCDYDTVGTEITLHIKEDNENEKYGEFLEEYRIKSLIKKYSDYIRYPIKMDVSERKLKDGTGVDGKDPEYETIIENQTLNSMVPLWHRTPSEITQEEYKNFYTDKFDDYEEPAKVMHFHTDGMISFEALLFIPKRAPYNYYTKSFEKGLRLYSNGVMIMDKCGDLLPDHYSFVKGLIDSPDFTLNISRETLQHDHQLKSIAKFVEKKIKGELANMLEDDREGYEAFFKEFGLQLKYGIYTGYGMNNEALQDLLLFKSSKEKKYVTFKEYVSRMKEGQNSIYYACGETLEAADFLPQTEAVKAKDFEVLYFTDDIDEFTIQMMMEYDGKKFVNVSAEDVDISSDEEKEALKKANEDNKEMLDFIKESLNDQVSGVSFTNTLGEHSVCLSNEGGISTDMEKVLNKMPDTDSNFRPKAETILKINMAHPVAEAMKSIYSEDRDKAANYAKILYGQARLISGLEITNPAELTELISQVIVDAGKK